MLGVFSLIIWYRESDDYKGYLKEDCGIRNVDITNNEIVMINTDKAPMKNIKIMILTTFGYIGHNENDLTLKLI